MQTFHRNLVHTSFFSARLPRGIALVHSVVKKYELYSVGSGDGEPYFLLLFFTWYFL